MAREDKPTVDPTSAPSGRLDELERRLETAFRQLEGRGDDGAASEGQSLRTRRAQLHQQLLSGKAGPSVGREIESLTDAIDQWVARIDRSQTHHTQRTVR